ncbi:MAG: hypothetical protein ACR2Q4_21810 [Geminicoccaceae bacterium]
MSDVRIVTLDNLIDRLEELLGRDSLLFRRFEQGLRLEDERSLTAAMTSLRLYPEPTRRLIEDTVMSWLFGTREDDLGQQREVQPLSW